MYYVVFAMISPTYLSAVDYLLKYVVVPILCHDLWPKVDTLTFKDVNLLHGLVRPLRPKLFVQSWHFVGLHLWWIT